MTETIEPTPIGSTTTITLAEVENRLADLATGQIGLEDIANTLNQMWAAAEARGDQETMQALPVLWQKAESLVQYADQSAAAAVAAVEIAREVSQQRDQIHDTYIKLHKAVVDSDLDHPLVGDLVEATEERVYEYVYWSGEYDDYSLEVAEDNVVAELRQSAKVHDESATRFAKWLLYMSYDTPPSDEHKAALKAAIEAAFPPEDDETDEDSGDDE
jgi:hypothetical protein